MWLKAGLDGVGLRVFLSYREPLSALVGMPLSCSVPAHHSLLKGCGHPLPGSLSLPDTCCWSLGNVESDTSRVPGTPRVHLLVAPCDPLGKAHSLASLPGPL